MPIGLAHRSLLLETQGSRGAGGRVAVECNFAHLSETRIDISF